MKSYKRMQAISRDESEIEALPDVTGHSGFAQIIPCDI
jgi:hypothetical protein